MSSDLAPDALNERLVSLLAALTAVSDGGAAVRAAVRGALAGTGVIGGALYRIDDQGDELLFAGQYGLPPEGAERARLSLATRHPLTLIAAAFSEGRDREATARELIDSFPLSALRVLQGNELDAVRTRALVLRFEGVPIGALGLVVRPDHGEWLPAPLEEGVRSALALWLAARGGTSTTARPRPHRVLVTPRQRQILALAEQGRTNNAIARVLGFSEATIKADLTVLYRLLEARSREELVESARRAGLLPAPEDRD